jgi:hypothetical protein
MIFGYNLFAMLLPVTLENNDEYPVLKNLAIGDLEAF